MVQFVGYEIFTAVAMKSSVFWDVTPYSPLKVNWRFRGRYRLHSEGRRISQTRNQRESKWLGDVQSVDSQLTFRRNVFPSAGSKNSKRTVLATCFYASFLLGLFFDPEDRDDLPSETSVDLHRTTRRYILEDRNIQVVQLFQRKSAIKKMWRKLCLRLCCVEIRFDVFNLLSVHAVIVKNEALVPGCLFIL
jgi:hypothetical protein